MGERLALLEHLGVAVLRLTVQRLEQPLKFEKVCAGLLIVAVVVKCDGEVELEEVVRLLPTPQLVTTVGQSERHMQMWRPVRSPFR